jgi:hypothetical protein
VSERGFLYVATGEKWVREALDSVARLKKVHPDVPAAMFTDMPELAKTAPFDDVITLPDQEWVNTEQKVWAVGRSPFERTVYLDTDIYVYGDLTDLFTVLDRFDFAAVPIQLRLCRRSDHADPTDIPEAFQSVNGGMFAYRRNDHTKELFELWWRLYQADKQTAASLMDQPSLRVALWRSECQVLLLPPEFNMRTIRYRVQPTTAVGPVRIIHGRPRDADALAARWNARDDLRLLTPLTQYQLRVMLRFLVRGRMRERLRSRIKPLLLRFAGGDGRARIRERQHQPNG